MKNNANSLREFIVPFDLAATKERVRNFGDKYSLSSEILDLRNQILRSDKIAEYANKEDVADFCISEILSLSKSTGEKIGEEIFFRSHIASNLVKSFAREEELLVGRMIEIITANPEQDPAFITLIASKYFYGTGVEKDPQEAVRLFRLAADQGSSKAQTSLGFCYEKGIGVEKDPQEAVRLYRLAVDQGHDAAQSNLGLCYYNGTGVEKDQKEAVRLFQLAADQGHALAQINLGLCYENGTGVEKDQKEAVRLFQLAADQGYAEAQNSLGFCYNKGDGVEKDPKEAVRLFQLAADQGHALAQVNLAVCYEKGDGVEKDQKEAVRLYRLAADQGSSKAQNNLGVCYEKGDGVEKDPKEAVRLYRLAADQGYVEAQNNLGFCYKKGIGVEKDPQEAVSLYRLASEKGYSIAQANLGACYHSGIGVEKDSSLGILFLARGLKPYSERQNFFSNYNLGIITVKGASVDRSSKNTPLSVSEIFEIISLKAVQERTSNNKSSFVGDLVEVSESKLSAADILKIYHTLSDVAGLDAAQSKSCEMIANCWAKKLGQEIGITGEEMAKIKVLSRSKNTIKCELPKVSDSRGLTTVSTVSSPLSWLNQFSRNSSETSKDDDLSTSLIDSDSLSADRKRQLVGMAESNGIIEIRESKNNSFAVVVDANEASRSTTAVSNPVYSPLVTQKVQGNLER